MAISTTALVASGLIALLGVAVTYLLRSSLGDTLEQSLSVGFVLLPILAQLQLAGGVHRALKRPISSAIFNSILRPVVLLALLLGLWFIVRQRITPALAIGASALAALIALILSLWLLAHIWPPKAKTARPRYEFRAWSTMGMHLLLLGAVGLVRRRLDVLVIGALAGSDAVGPYYAAMQLVALTNYGTAAVDNVLAPMIAERYRASEHEAIKELMHRAAWLTFTVTAAIATVLATCGYWLLGLFGPAFTVAYAPLLIILAAKCLTATAGSTGTLMIMTRFERQTAFMAGGVAALDLLLCLLLVPLLGIAGAAVATAASSIAGTCCGIVFIRRRIKFNTTIFRCAAI